MNIDITLTLRDRWYSLRPKRKRMQPEDKERAKAAGFDAHLTKPLDFNRVKNSIAEKITQKANKGS